MSFSLASIEKNGETVAAIQTQGRLWPLAAAAAELKIEGISQTLIDIFKNWTQQADLVKQVGQAIESGAVSSSLSMSASDAEFKIPLQYPPKVYCIGANYADHLAEMNVEIPKREAPFFYMKPASTALAGPGKTVYLPPGCEDFDWEVEVVMVFGRGGRNIPKESALDYVAGYTLGVDFTARDQFLAPHLPFKFDFALGKCQDRTAPIGPVIVPKEFVNIEDLRFSLSVNGVKKQESSTRHMIYSLAEQIAGVSKVIQIEPGDILFSGSPAGVGAPRGERLKAGDSVVVESDLTGAMEVIIQAPQTTATPRL